MHMGTAKEDLKNLLGIFNPHYVCNYAKDRGLPDVAVTYRPVQTGRGSLSAAWQVYRPGKRTTTEANPWWGDHGLQTFTIYHGSERNDRLQEALAWASDRYGITEWDTITGVTSFGWFPADVVRIVKADLKAARAAAK